MFQKEIPRDDDSYPLYADTNTSFPLNWKIVLIQSLCGNSYVLSTFYTLTVLSAEYEAKRPLERGITLDT